MTAPELVTITYNVGVFCMKGLSKYLYLDTPFVHTASQILVSMLGIVLVAIYYTVAFDTTELFKLLSYCFCIFLSGLLFISATNLIIIFVAYEFILVPTILVLELFSKTTRAREATYFMIL